MIAGNTGYNVCILKITLFDNGGFHFIFGFSLYCLKNVTMNYFTHEEVEIHQRCVLEPAVTSSTILAVWKSELEPGDLICKLVAGNLLHDDLIDDFVVFGFGGGALWTLTPTFPIPLISCVH